MKYSITPQTNLSKVPSNTEQVHLVRPVTPAYMEKLMQKCALDSVSMSKSCFQRLGSNAKKMLKRGNVNIVIQDNRGRAIEMDMEKLLKVIDMYRDDHSYREIEEEMSIPKSTAHYLIRYAERTKIKSGNDTVYLQKLD